MSKRQLILEDGTVFVGEGFGSEDVVNGEVVFNTGMTGYQEILTDPSYAGQIVLMTYPVIGDYGINRDDSETVTPFLNGLIVKEYCDYPSNFRSDETLDAYLKANHVPGLCGIDTRKLTRHIRDNGTMKGRIAKVDEDTSHVVASLKSEEDDTNYVEKASTTRPYVVPGRGQRIVLVDYGMKHGLLRELTKRDCHVTVVPYNYDAERILRMKPDGIMLSNGPGNPNDINEAVSMVNDVIGKVPLFGIGLGHQLLALACGANTKKMLFGHRGVNYPVKDLERNKTYLTSQNHSYHICHDSLKNTELTITQISLNDNSIEGLRHTKYPAFSVQYQPESAPGPEDTNHLFDEFLEMIGEAKQNHEEEEQHA